MAFCKATETKKGAAKRVNTPIVYPLQEPKLITKIGKVKVENFTETQKQVLFR